MEENPMKAEDADKETETEKKNDAFLCVVVLTRTSRRTAERNGGDPYNNHKSQQSRGNRDADEREEKDFPEGEGNLREEKRRARKQRGRRRS